MQEIERKYLLKPDILKFLASYPHNCKKIVQFYTKVTPDVSVRFRKIGKHYYKTVKKGKGGIRDEYEKEVSKKSYVKNFSKRIGYVIRKKRCFFEMDQMIYSVDIYKKPFKGLLILEVEFNDKDTFKKFVLPKSIIPYVDKEVTEDEAYKNKNLAFFGLPLTKKKFFAIEHLMQKLQSYNNDILKAKKKILNNGDHEELHVFRVTLRTSISLLKSCHFMCDEKGCLYFKSLLKEILTITNRKRDLDVLQLRLIAMEKDIHSEELKKAFTIFYKEIALLIKEEQKYIQQYLHSQQFDNIMKEYTLFIHKTYKQHLTFYSKYGIRPVCGNVILRNFEKIEQRIFQFEKKQNENILHKLRIDFKRMRYLLENFKFLYNKKKIKTVVIDVKKLQNILGKFHDAYQQKMIFLDFLRDQKDTSVVFLIENLILPQIENREKKEIKRIRKKLKRFLEGKRNFRELFLL
jgi:CHAD domain-containing protein/CYTH domain-containing protein